MNYQIRVLSTIVALFAVTMTVSAQDDATSLMDAGEFVDQNYLELTNNLLAIYPPIPEEGVETYNQGINDLIAVYESEERNADTSTDELKEMVENAKQQEDIVKAKIDVAKKAEDEAEQGRLEELKKTHEDRRKYLERIRKIRELERNVFDARLAYLKKLREAVEKASQLSALREREEPSIRDLLAVEKELIELSKETSELNDKLAGEAKKLNNERLNAFNEREEILEDLEKVSGSN